MDLHSDMAKLGDPYEKIVFWSEEDQVFIGMCPEIMYGGVHGNDPVKVFKELLQVVDEWVEICEEDRKLLPAPKHAVIQASGCQIDRTRI
jgi:predicted RNase H-like HicB family nuclease